jgi:hypothetical protein
MKMFKERTRAMSAVNDERRQALPSKVIWDGIIDRFEVFRNSVEGHYGQMGAAYLFDSSFQEAYLERGVDCYLDFLDEIPFDFQIKKASRALYGALHIACQSGVGRRILMENRDKQHDIRSCYQLIQQYETYGDRNIRIKRIENVIKTVFHRNYREGLVNGFKTVKVPSQNWLYLGKRLGMMMKLRSVGLYRMLKILVWLIQLLKNYLVIRLDQQYKEKAARQIHNTSQSSNRAKKDKVKIVLALINEIQIQDSRSSDEESATVPPTKTAMVCK